MLNSACRWEWLLLFLFIWEALKEIKEVSPDRIWHEQSVCFSQGVGGIFKWSCPTVHMPTRCGNLLVQVMVGVEYKNPIFQLSLWQVKEGGCLYCVCVCVGFITWLASVRVVQHKLWLAYFSLQYETAQEKNMSLVNGNLEFIGVGNKVFNFCWEMRSEIYWGSRVTFLLRNTFETKHFRDVEFAAFFYVFILFITLN